MSRAWTPEELQAASSAMKAAGHMSYEEFSAEFNITMKAQQIIDDFATTQKAGTPYCPRCGKMTIKKNLCTNALSRHANVYICDACGMDEAVRDCLNEPLQLKEWAVVALQ